MHWPKRSQRRIRVTPGSWIQVFRNRRLRPSHLKIAASLLVALAALALNRGRDGAQADSGSDAQSARPGDVEIAVHAGFGELTVLGLGAWVPFRIVLRNNGEGISGKLIVHAAAPPNQQSREFVEAISLPAHSI